MISPSRRALKAPERGHDSAGALSATQVVGAARRITATAWWRRWRRSALLAANPRRVMIRKLLAELGDHGVAGLDGDHLGAPVCQEPGRDTSARADVRDASTPQRTAQDFLDGLEECGRI